MKSATLTSHTITSTAEVFRELASYDVWLADSDLAESYLTQHPALGALLPEIIKAIRAAFGSSPELVMKVYEDPEIADRYLTLYIRQDCYEPDFLDRIDAVIAEFADMLESVTGFLLVTTDFRRTGENHVV